MTRRETTRRPRPVLMFAGAAAIVALLAVPILLFTGGGRGNVADSTSTTLTSPTTTESNQTTTRPIVGVNWAGYMFVYQMPQNSFKNDPALVPMLVSIDLVESEIGSGDPETANFTDALAKMTREGTIPEPYENAIPEGVRILSEVEGSLGGADVIQAEMSQEFAAGAGGLLADFTMLNQLIYTLTIGNEHHGVLFTIDGEPVTEFGTDGLDLSQPVDRNTFIDNLALIFVTELSLQDNGDLHVSGTSNTFEASMAMAVLDGSGNVVEEQFIQATGGSGSWGTYEATVRANLIVPGESIIRLFQHSQEGSGGLVDLIEIPIPELGIWNLTGRPDAINGS